jgi:aspartyl-tRNA(Asn)/glutamyl-tRNA(Gln) amidotransferase subunit C
MIINDELIEKLENLAKLKLDTDEKNEMKSQLEAMIGMFSKIEEVDTTNVKPLVHLTDAINQWHEDIPVSNLTTEQAISLAPKSVGVYFSVPKVLE